MRRPVKVSEAVSASFLHARPPRNGAGRKKSTVTHSDIRGSTEAAAQSAVRTELPRTFDADQVEPAARGASRILRGCHRPAPIFEGRYVGCCYVLCCADSVKESRIVVIPFSWLACLFGCVHTATSIDDRLRWPPGFPDLFPSVGMHGASEFCTLLDEKRESAGASTCRAIAQANPSSSRATATAALQPDLPRCSSRRNLRCRR